MSLLNLDALFSAPLAIQVHVYFALAAFFLGAMVLWRKKGSSSHKRWGKIWVLLMVGTAMSSFFIHQIQTFGPFSWIHLISVGTLISLYLGVRQAQAKQIAKHQSSMKATYIGGMLFAGGLTFLPGRLMSEIAIEPSMKMFFADEAKNIFQLELTTVFIMVFSAAGLSLLLGYRKLIIDKMRSN